MVVNSTTEHAEYILTGLCNGGGVPKYTNSTALPLCFTYMSVSPTCERCKARK